MEQPLDISIDGGIAVLTLNNPPVNAFDTTSQFAMATAIEGLGRNDDVRVIIIRAEGRGFHAGVDVKELAGDNSLIIEQNRANYQTYEVIHRNPKPVIAAVHGYVLGGGIGICGSADIVVASDCARFGVPEIDRGAMGMGAHLQRMFPVQKVRYMYFTGEFIDAAEAYRLGAIEKLVPKDEVLTAAQEIAAKIAAKSPVMMRIAKESLNGVEDGNLEDKYRWEQGFTFEAYMQKDSQEAREAFIDKRDASFKDK